MERYSGVFHAVGLALVLILVGALAASHARRRVRELALLSAIGASPRVLAALLVGQAALVGLLGGAAGWGIAQLVLYRAGPAILGTGVPVPGELLVTAMLAAGLASALGAAGPAVRAAHLDPTQTLREA
jgi:putative ABC transport system permease protein